MNSHIFPHIIQIQCLQKYNKQNKPNIMIEPSTRIKTNSDLSLKALNMHAHKQYNNPLGWATKYHGPNKP